MYSVTRINNFLLYSLRKPHKQYIFNKYDKLLDDTYRMLQFRLNEGKNVSVYVCAMSLEGYIANGK